MRWSSSGAGAAEGQKGGVNFELPVSLHVSKSFPFLKEGGNESGTGTSKRTHFTYAGHTQFSRNSPRRERGGNKYLHFQYEILI